MTRQLLTISYPGERLYICPVCGKGHRWKDEMYKCENTHAGIFKFPCPHATCAKQFQTRSDENCWICFMVLFKGLDWICTCEHMTGGDLSNVQDVDILVQGRIIFQLMWRKFTRWDWRKLAKLITSHTMWKAAQEDPFLIKMEKKNNLHSRKKEYK